MPTWNDVATGLRVEYVDLTAIGAPPSAERVSPTPFEGPQFRVTTAERGFIQGYARNDVELAALGVSAECIAAIRARAAGPVTCRYCGYPIGQDRNGDWRHLAADGGPMGDFDRGCYAASYSRAGGPAGWDRRLRRYMKATPPRKDGAPPMVPPMPPPVTGTCDADGYTEVGTQGDERYWHCEVPAVVIDPDGLKLCAAHAEEYWPDLIPGLI